MSERQFSARIDGDGQLRIDNLPEFNAYIEEFAGRRVVLTLADWRSLAANRFYWAGIVEPIRQYFSQKNGVNYSKDAIHRQLSDNYGETELSPSGIVSKSTTRMSRKRFSRYCDEIIGDFSAPPYAITFAKPGEDFE
jgi:hypothetical protein